MLQRESYFHEMVSAKGALLYWAFLIFSLCKEVLGSYEFILISFLLGLGFLIVIII